MGNSARHVQSVEDEKGRPTGVAPSLAGSDHHAPTLNNSPCRNAFLGLTKTCTKLGVAFWDYLGSRLGVSGQFGTVPLNAKRLSLVIQFSAAITVSGH